MKERVYPNHQYKDRSCKSLNLSINSLNLSAIPKEYPQPSCSYENSIIIVDTTKNEVISVIDNSAEQPLPQAAETETASCPEDKKDGTIYVIDNSTIFEKTVPRSTSEDRKDETITSTANCPEEKECDDDVQFIPQEVEIINICDDSAMPSSDSSSDEEDDEEEEEEDSDEEMEEGELSKTKLKACKDDSRSKSVIYLEDSESVVEISDDDDDDGDIWEKRKLPNFLSFDVKKVCLP